MYKLVENTLNILPFKVIGSMVELVQEVLWKNDFFLNFVGIYDLRLKVCNELSLVG